MMKPSTEANQFLEALNTKYPTGDERVESEIRNLKRKLHVNDEFSDCDEHELIQVLKKWRMS